MRKHYTPEEVASSLAMHCPKGATRILDPCVGEGALAKAILAVLPRKAHFTALDIDQRALGVFEAFGRTTGHEIEAISQSFFSWLKLRQDKGYQEAFDCVVMNPPFCGRPSMWISRDEISQCIDGGFDVPARIPIEAGFFLGGISVLEDNGVILAILPPSLAAGELNGWFRELLHRSGTVVRMHELPKYTFPQIESRMYLCVFRRTKGPQRLILLNHDLLKPKQLNLVQREPRARLDFAFQAALHRAKLMQNADLGEWLSVCAIADVLRGTITDKSRFANAIHSSNYHGGFWHRQPHARDENWGSNTCAQTGDILVQRVSRNCVQSFGIFLGVPRAYTDCVLAIRPKPNHNTVKMLFALRTMLRKDMLAGLLERGNGATYIASSSLRTLQLPWNVSRTFSKLFRDYTSAVRSLDFPAMLQIEGETAARIRGRICEDEPFKSNGYQIRL